MSSRHSISKTIRRSPSRRLLPNSGSIGKFWWSTSGKSESSACSAKSERRSVAREPSGDAVPSAERQACRVFEGSDSSPPGGADEMSTVYNVIKRPIITEKGLTLKERDRTLCFEVDDNASKQQIQEAVEQLFKVKVEAVRTMVVPGKMRRRGKYSGYRPDWKKAYVTLREGEKMIEYGENL